MRYLSAVCICIGFMTSYTVFAEEVEITFLLGGASPDWLHIRKSSDPIQVISNDEVKGGCWVNVDNTRNAVALELQRSGYKVNVIENEKEDVPSGHRLYISALGYSTISDLCVVTYTAELWIMKIVRPVFEQKFQVITVRREIIWSRTGLLSGPRSTTSAGIKESFVSLAQKLLLDIKSNQEKVLNEIRNSAHSYKDKQPASYEFWSNYNIE